MKLSVYISFFRDYTFFQDAIDRIYDIADEIIIVDGPLFATLPIFAVGGVEADRKTCVDEIYERCPVLMNSSKVKYHWNIWDSEAQKRIFAYSQCSGDLVLRVDADEMFDIDSEALEEFIESDCQVAGFDIITSYTDKILIGSSIKEINQLPVVHTLFKAAIPAERHIDYLWLCGSNLETPNKSIIYTKSIGDVYHPYLARSPSGGIQKLGFYLSLDIQGKNDGEIIQWAKLLNDLILDITQIPRIHATAIGFPEDPAKIFFTDPDYDKRNHLILERIRLQVEKNRIEELEYNLSHPLTQGKHWVRLQVHNNKAFITLPKKSTCNVVDASVFVINDREPMNSMPLDKLKIEEHGSEISVTLKQDEPFFDNPVMIIEIV